MTATINRSQIFKNAWNFVRTLALSISEALKQAWAEAKNGIGAMAVVAPMETMPSDFRRFDVNNKGTRTHFKPLQDTEKEGGYEVWEQYDDDYEAWNLCLVFRNFDSNAESITEKQISFLEQLRPMSFEVEQNKKDARENRFTVGQQLDKRSECIKKLSKRQASEAIGALKSRINVYIF